MDIGLPLNLDRNLKLNLQRNLDLDLTINVLGQDLKTVSDLSRDPLCDAITVFKSDF